MPEWYIIYFCKPADDLGASYMRPACTAPSFISPETLLPEREKYEREFTNWLDDHYPELLEYLQRNDIEYSIKKGLKNHNSSLAVLTDFDSYVALKLKFMEHRRVMISPLTAVQESKKKALEKLEVARREREKREYEAIKARYFELKALYEPDA